MSRNYKYSFADQLLIHAQRPDASACAGYDVWTGRMGRYVRRGAKGIALHHFARHLLGFFAGIPGARAYRRYLSDNMTKLGADARVLEEAFALVRLPADGAESE